MGTIKQNFANNVETGGKHDAKDLSGTVPASNIANSSLSDVTAVNPAIGDLRQTVSSDPSPASFGDIWYNSTSQKVRLKQKTAGSWATGGNMGTARGNGLGGAGTQTAALAFGGDGGTNLTETYNGSSWSETAELSTGRAYLSGTGLTQTAALAVGGNGVGVVESWDGSSWTEVADVPVRGYSNLAGSYTSAIVTGGFNPSYGSGNDPSSQEWNGSSWAETAEMNTPRYAAAGCGINAEAVIIAGGSSSGGPGSAVAETWNGSSWTEVSDLNQARYNFKGSGTSTDALVFGGGGPASANLVGNTEEWNGSSWTEVSDLATRRRGGGSATGGTTSSSLAFGGNGTPEPAVPNVNSTEEWDAPVGAQSIQGS